MHASCGLVHVSSDEKHVVWGCRRRHHPQERIDFGFVSGTHLTKLCVPGNPPPPFEVEVAPEVALEMMVTMQRGSVFYANTDGYANTPGALNSAASAAEQTMHDTRLAKWTAS